MNQPHQEIGQPMFTEKERVAMITAFKSLMKLSKKETDASSLSQEFFQTLDGVTNKISPGRLEKPFEHYQSMFIKKDEEEGSVGAPFVGQQEKNYYVPLDGITLKIDNPELKHLVSALFMYRELSMDHLSYQDVLSIDSILFRKIGIQPSEDEENEFD